MGRLQSHDNGKSRWIAIADASSMRPCHPTEQERGRAKCPVVTVKDGEPNIASESDYQVSNVNNVNVGLATAIVTGRGNYSGVVYKAFEITGGSGQAPDWTPVVQRPKSPGASAATPRSRSAALSSPGSSKSARRR